MSSYIRLSSRPIARWRARIARAFSRLGFWSFGKFQSRCSGAPDKITLPKLDLVRVLLGKTPPLFPGGLDRAGGERQSPAPTPEGRLPAPDPHKRAALLLTAGEASSREETAFILDESAADVERAILDAQRMIDRQLASRVLIIEDEPII